MAASLLILFGLTRPLLIADRLRRRAGIIQLTLLAGSGMLRLLSPRSEPRADKDRHHFPIQPPESRLTTRDVAHPTNPVVASLQVIAAPLCREFGPPRRNP